MSRSGLFCPVFPVELFWCGVRHEALRLFLSLTGALSLVLSMLVLMGTYFAVAPWGGTALGAKLLTALTFSVALDLFIVLGLSVPFALRAATAEDDLPLMMMTGQIPLALWRARVWSAALPALIIPVLHLPLLAYVFTMGGVQWPHVGAMAVFWLAVWGIATGWAALGGCLWSGVARDRMQGMSLTLILVFIYGVAWVIVGRVLWLIGSPGAWWALRSFQPPWSLTPAEFLQLGVHVAFGLLAGRLSVIVLRGRWRAAVEVGSKEGDHTLPSVAKLKTERSAPLVERPHFPGERAPDRPRCGSDPWFWKDFHVSGGSWLFWQIRLGVAAALSAMVLVGFGYGMAHRSVEPVIFLTMLGWFIWMMVDVGQILAVEFQDRMWPIVRITPDTVGQILWHKLLAFAARFSPSLLPLGLACGLGLMSYAWEMVIYGLPFLLLFSLPFATLVLYGSAIPQNLIGGGWPMLRTFAGFLVMVGTYLPVMILIDKVLPRGSGWFLHAVATVLLSAATTIWFGYATVCELRDPRRERLSADGG